MKLIVKWFSLAALGFMPIWLILSSSDARCFCLFIVSYAVLHVATGIQGAGYSFTYFQREFDCFGMRKRDFEREKSLFLLCMWGGPVAYATAIDLEHDEHGWLWPWSATARREAQGEQ